MAYHERYIITGLEGENGWTVRSRATLEDAHAEALEMVETHDDVTISVALGTVSLEPTINMLDPKQS